jgi:hypothetical protein
MNKLFLIVCLSFILSSCGKSPLLKEITPNVGGNQALETFKMFQTTGAKVELKWLTALNTTEEGKAIVMITKDGRLFEDTDISLGAYLWMESMGHGSSPIVVEKLAKGIYQLTEIYFTMTKDWQLHLTLSKNGTIVENIKFEYYLNQ